MMVNKYILIFITLVITLITDKILKLSFLVGGVITVSIVVIGYIIYINYKQKNRYSIIEEELDPEKFIDSTYDAYKYSGKNKQLNSLLNCDLAVGHISMGEFKKAKEFLEKVDISELPKRNKSELAYYNMCLIVYYNLDMNDKAEKIYNQAKDYKIKDKTAEDMMSLLLANKYYNEGKYMESKELLEDYMKNTMSKRLELEIIFELANIEEKMGNKEDAILKYKRVVEEANKLYIVELSRENLNNLLLSE